MDTFSVRAWATLLPGPEERLRAPYPAEGKGHLRGFADDPCVHEGIPAKLGRRIDPFAALALRVVTRLLSGITTFDPDLTGVFFANTMGGWSYAEKEVALLTEKGPHWVHPYFVTAWFPPAAQGEVTILHGLRGRSKTTTGGTSALGEAFWLARDALEHGAVDTVIVGAVESLAASVVLDTLAGRSPAAEGPVEGAVVLALSAGEAASDGTCHAVLEGLHYDKEARERPGGRRFWSPPLSHACALVEAVAAAADTGRRSEADLGGGYRVSIRPASAVGRSASGQPGEDTQALRQES
ncbi:beta-ketoacyl synthase N-terminal-like domain-containing protein [Streptomyces goshikiensis]|uniref:beta-ketoacyl synthase N-terminal-like domain-containing protein n=1 Tax=Streptomyces goshikiensis TaxID=1942 RepID=UPI0036CCD4CE